MSITSSSVSSSRLWCPKLTPSTGISYRADNGQFARTGYAPAVAEAFEIPDLANACINAVRQSVGVELDWTQDTLPVLDHYASTVDRDATTVTLLSPMLGAYFGEVIRQALQEVRWFGPRGAYAEWRIEFERCFLYFNPVGLAAEALTGGAVEGSGGHLQMLDEDRPDVAHALDVFGPVDEADYYRFSVRFEAIEQAHAALVRKLTAAGKPTAFYPAQAYAAATSNPQ